MTDALTRRRAWIAWIAVCLLWGTTYLAIKVCLETIPPFLMGGLRYTAAGLILLAAAAFRGGRVPAWSSWPRQAVLGFFMIVLGHGGVVWGEQYVSSGLTAVMVGTNAFWMAGVDTFFADGERFHARQWLGMAVGFAGIVLLVWPDVAHGGGLATGLIAGVIVLQVACVGWAIGSAWSKRHPVKGDVLGPAAVQMIAGGLSLLVIGTVTGEWPHLAFNTKTTLSFIYLTVPGAAIAFAAFTYALRHLPVTIASLYVYVNPVIAVALGALLLGEPFDLRMLAAVGIIIAGMMIVRPGRPRRVARSA